MNLHCDMAGVDAELIERETGDHIATVFRLQSQSKERHSAIATMLAASGAMLAALRLAKPVCADAYYDALAVQENPTGDAVNHPVENAESTAAALTAWEAVNAAIALAEGREPEPLELPGADTTDATAGGIIPPTTDDLGAYVRDMLGDGYIDSAEPQGVERDSIDQVDDSDASNLRLHMASGAVFVVRIVREG